MSDGHQSSVTMIRHVAERLGNLRKLVVFLGGAVTGLLLTDAAAPEARSTKDVDIIVEIGSYTEYAHFEEALRSLGLIQVQDVICRWNFGGVLVDVMPTDETVLGFSNRWYSHALETAEDYDLTAGLIIRLVTAPCFVATKLEAFRHPHRENGGDYLLSRDMADIIAVLDGRQELVSEIISSDEGVRVFLQEQFQQMLSDRDFWDALPAHLLPDEASQRRLSLLIQRVENIVKNRTSGA